MASPSKPLPPKKHHTLICGTLYFSDTENPERIQSLQMNGVLIIDTQNINAAAIGKSQQILQMHFHKRMDGMAMTVHDVVIHQFSYLGFMSQDEFEAPPPGTRTVAKVPDLDAAVASAKPAND